MDEVLRWARRRGAPHAVMLVIYLLDEKGWTRSSPAFNNHQPSFAVVERPCVEAYATLKSNDRGGRPGHWSNGPRAVVGKEAGTPLDRTRTRVLAIRKVKGACEQEHDARKAHRPSDWWTGEASTGASDDLRRATGIATAMITRCGIVQTLGLRN